MATHLKTVQGRLVCCGTSVEKHCFRSTYQRLNSLHSQQPGVNLTKLFFLVKWTFPPFISIKLNHFIVTTYILILQTLKINNKNRNNEDCRMKRRLWRHRYLKILITIEMRTKKFGKINSFSDRKRRSIRLVFSFLQSVSLIRIRVARWLFGSQFWPLL